MAARAGRSLTPPVRSRLPRSFFARPATEVAPDLLGCVVAHDATDGRVAVRLTEVEAYLGEQDPGSHAFRGRTPRTAVMFGPPGHAYVYFSYGMHWCMNLVCAPDGTASAVLLRGGEVIEGEDLAASRRGGVRARDLARGPARLAAALGIDRAADGADAVDGSSLQVLAPSSDQYGDRARIVLAGPRTGVGGAGAQRPWRFYLDGEPTVSPYRPHQPRRPTQADPARSPRQVDPARSPRQADPARTREQSPG